VCPIRNAGRLVFADSGARDGFATLRAPIIGVRRCQIDKQSERRRYGQMRGGSMKRTRISKTVSATVIGVLAVASGRTYGQAQPQQRDNSTMEEVVVTGIRASLQHSLELKSTATGVVDAISAEDLGKFPDTNIAESLQRIPGVAISRSDGEGQFITVRGLGPSFNEVVVNGRQIASEQTTRAFSFDLYPSETITGAEVYKSGVANLPTGGIGATINLRTARPFDFDGEQTIFSAKGLYEDYTKKLTPDLFALYSNNFASRTVGALLAVSYSKRQSRTDEMDLQWASFNPATALAPGTTFTNPANVTTGFYPIQYQQLRTFDERERTNIEGALQFKPRDNLTFTLDGMLNIFKDERHEGWFLTFQNLTNMNNIALDNNGSVQSFTNNASGAYETGSALQDRRVQTRNVGVNMNWQPTPELDVIFDLSYSSAAQPAGDNGFANLGFRGPFSMGLTGEFPNLTIGVDQATLLNKSNYLSHVIIFGKPAFGGDNVHDTIYEPKVELIYKPSDGGVLKSIRLGVDFTADRKNDVWLGNNPQVYCLYCGYLSGNTVPASLLQNYDLSNFLSGVPGAFPRTYYTFNPYAVATYLSTPAALANNDAAHGYAPGTSQAMLTQYGNGGWGLLPISGGYRVQEYLTAAYFDETLAGKFGGRPWAMTFGMRYVYTQTTAGGFSQTPVALGYIDPTQYSITYANPNPTIGYQSSSYGKLLPNMDFRLTLANGLAKLNDSLLFRFATSQTLSQPQLSDIAPSLTFSTPRPNQLAASGGNINLKPYVSTNFDMALEYYFGGINYVSIGAFRKDIENFVVYEAVPSTYTILNPDNLHDSNISGTSATFAVTEPVNAKTARLTGVEMAGQVGLDFLPAPFNGLGVTANATIVHSDATLNPANYSQSFAIPGLSNTENLTLFYAKGRIDARIAENWRSKFLNTFSGFATEPTYINSYHQVDARVSVDLSGHTRLATNVFVEGTNITKQKQFQSGRFSNQFGDYQDIGARYAVGARVKF
jgi:iron complex outermembrane recepter protein